MWPVTVSASTSSTRWPRRTWSVAARLIEIVVLPTPPFGLNTQTTVARFVQAAESRPLSDSMIGPLPSSTVWARMSMASTRQRSESAQYGRVKYSSLIVAFVVVADELLEVPRRDDHQGRDVAAVLVEQRVVLERLVEVALAIEDREGEVAARLEQGPELLGRGDGDDVVAGSRELALDGRQLFAREGDGDGLAGHRRGIGSGGAGPSPRTRDRGR